MIVQARIVDAERFKAYTQVVPGLVARFGGRYRVLGGTPTTLEGVWPEVKTVVSEWPDRASAQAFWDSHEYAQARKLREGTGEFTVVLIDGCAAAPAAMEAPHSPAADED
ncbi:MAG: DUF1330 domain-containing protein [Rubrivivax sp.]